MDFKYIKNKMISFLQTQSDTIGTKRVVVGLSGGLDSAVVAVLCKEVFSNGLTAILMPTKYSSKSSVDDAIELCNKFDIKYEIVDISPMVDGYFNNIKDATNLRVGNFSARMRMSVLYDVSSRENAIVVGTSNRSEILLGYGTLYGDTACAINPIGNMYKSDEFEFAKYLGVTDAIINKKPSADLWEGQSDEDELGYSYNEIDKVLKAIYDDKKTKSQLILDGMDNSLVNMVINRVNKNSFKTRMPLIAPLD